MNTKCHCKAGQQRDNCPDCEGTGIKIDFVAVRAKKTTQGLRGSYRTTDGKAQIEWSLEQKENGLEFSASGEYDRSAGQCLDDIAEAYPQDEMIQRIAKVWRVHHLNGMQGGTPEQMREIEKQREAAEEDARKLPDAARHFYDKELKKANWHSLCRVFGYDSFYAWEYYVLKSAGLYEVPLPEGLTATGGFPEEVTSGKRGYRFGERWVYLAIPDDVVKEIESWNAAPKPSGTLADHKTAQFFKRNGIHYRMTLSDSKPAPWEPCGYHYRITLSRDKKLLWGQTGMPLRLAFDFWGSQADAASGKAPTPASVLSCIASDIGTPATFEDCCDEYGEDVDSIKARQTFKRASRHAERLRAFFTEKEQKDLQDIR